MQPSLTPVFEETGRFRKDIRRFDQTRRKQLERLVNSIADGDPHRKAIRYRIDLPDCTSSLHYARFGRPPCFLLFTIEDDPLFGERRITLLGAPGHDVAEITLRGLAEHMYGRPGEDNRIELSEEQS